MRERIISKGRKTMLENMFKMLGLDPQEIKNQVAAAAERFNMVVAHFDRKFDGIDQRLAAIEQKLGGADVLQSCQITEQKGE